MISWPRLAPTMLALVLAAPLAGCESAGWFPAFREPKPAPVATSADTASKPASAPPPAAEAPNPSPPASAPKGWFPAFRGSKPAPVAASADKALKPAPAPSPAAEAPKPSPLASAPILTTRDQLLPSPDVLDRVICVVNNDAITQYELDEAEAYYLSETKEQRVQEGEARKALRERLLQTIIENRIQLQQAEREKIVVEDAELSEHLAEVMKRLKAKDEKELAEIIKVQGLTLEGVKKRLREQLMVQRVIRRKVALRISVTEQEIDKYLAENRDKLETGLTFEARHILFLPEAGKGEEGWLAARKKADEVYGLLLEGQEFGQLARKHSEDASGKDGGSLGHLKRGELAADIEEAILRLQPGEASTPFRSRVGYHLFRLDSREALTGEALRQVRSQIRDILYRQKYEARLKNWLVEIKQRAIIDIRM